MTINPDKPTLRSPAYPGDRTRTNGLSWGIGALAALAVLGLIFWAVSGNNRDTASNTTGNRTATSATDTNTGSASSRPAQPSSGQALPTRP